MPTSSTYLGQGCRRNYGIYGINCGGRKNSEEYYYCDTCFTKFEREMQEKERIEKERIEKERIEKERIEKEMQRLQRIEREMQRLQRIEKERQEKERQEQEKERLEREKQKQERIQKERIEKERIEKERIEKERIEKERIEKERQEKERIKKEREIRAKGNFAKQLETTNLTQAVKEKALFCSIHQGKLKDPQSLSCLHSFCKSCLHDFLKLANKQAQEPLRCPVCQSEFAAAHQGNGHQGDFPALYFTQNYLSAFQGDQDQNSIACLCEENEALFFCSDCHEYLCQGCKKAHQKARLTAGHEVIPIEEALAGNYSQSRKAFCPEHLAAELNTLCKSCDTVVCSTCSVQYHNGHSLALLSGEVARFKEDIKDFWIQGSMRKEGLEKGIKEARRIQTSLNQNTLETEQKIKSSFEKIHRLVDKRQEELLTQLNEKQKGKEKNLVLKREELEFEGAAVQALVQYTEVLYLEGTDVEIATTKKRVEARMKTLQELETETEIAISPSIGFDPLNQAEMQRALGSFGRITI